MKLLRATNELEIEAREIETILEANKKIAQLKITTYQLALQISHQAKATRKKTELLARKKFFLLKNVLLPRIEESIQKLYQKHHLIREITPELIQQVIAEKHKEQESISAAVMAGRLATQSRAR